MPVRLRSIATAVPTTAFAQSEIRDIFTAQPELTRLGQRLISAAFDASGIETRYSVVEELSFSAQDGEPQFYDAGTGRILSPGTGARNELYIEQATPLFLDAGRRALDACPDLSTDDVTHVITVSCTGFYAPGPDYQVVRGLGLRASTQRYHLGFMGCYAAFPALRAAKAFCDVDPNAVVLVICAELCTLHVRSSNDPDTIVANSVFADGAAAAIVTARPAPPDMPTLVLDSFETVLTPVGEADMAWKIGEAGFEMVLSGYVPRIIEEHIRGALAPLLAHDADLPGLPYRDIEHWAIHPGGRSILDKVEINLGLTPEQLEPSRAILHDYGNMSSATVLFVLKRILEAASPAEADAEAQTDGVRSPGSERVCAMAFGPGLTVETALMTRVPAVAARAGADALISSGASAE
ncbi:type III polyketide synthase [Planctomonas psychrotolerans]|uniref:type III polyketide synthase n=1 Tax=Planctomonas psychrotolerans TaxID=2528712 RepID=UPI00123B248D|nr:type III polyketide synthase [Planctomonas psychrotolerans]